MQTRVVVQKCDRFEFGAVSQGIGELYAGGPGAVDCDVLAHVPAANGNIRSIQPDSSNAPDCAEE